MGFTRNIAADRALLGSLLDRLGLPTSPISLLLAHAYAVQASAERLGLVAPADVDVVVSRHTADSLLFAMAREPRPGESWLDIGSGAGFPGIPLACCFPLTAFTLVEPLKKRSGFLELVAGDLGLSNVSVVAQRLEDSPAKGFDVAVARALAGPAGATESALGRVRRSGEVCVAIGSPDLIARGARLVGVEVPGDVDSPGLFSMMTREG
jgi:16S rRNA (guanine527-N7)-methyltransferase